MGVKTQEPDQLNIFITFIASSYYVHTLLFSFCKLTSPRLIKTRNTYIYNLSEACMLKNFYRYTTTSWVVNASISWKLHRLLSLYKYIYRLV